MLDIKVSTFKICQVTDSARALEWFLLSSGESTILTLHEHPVFSLTHLHMESDIHDKRIRKKKINDYLSCFKPGWKKKTKKKKKKKKQKNNPATCLEHILEHYLLPVLLMLR